LHKNKCLAGCETQAPSEPFSAALEPFLR